MAHVQSLRNRASPSLRGGHQGRAGFQARQQRDRVEALTRDPLAIAGHHVIQTAIRTGARDHERFGWRSMIEQFVSEGRDFRCVSIPVARTRTWSETIRLDYDEPHPAGGASGQSSSAFQEQENGSKFNK